MEYSIKCLTYLFYMSCNLGTGCQILRNIKPFSLTFLFIMNHLVFFAHLIICILDSGIELLSLDDERPVARLDDAALGCDGAGSVDIVASDHTHGDAGPLALFDGLGHLGSNGVFDAHHAQRGQVAKRVLFIFEVGHFGVVMHLRKEGKI